MTSILLLAPTFDVPTSTSTLAAEELAIWLAQQNVAFDQLAGPFPTRWLFETYLANHPEVAGVFYLGHGQADALIGSEILSDMVDAANDAGTLARQGLITWTMACYSSLQLGPDVVAKGGAAYFGHTVEYEAAFPDQTHDFLGDWVDYVLATPKALVQGATAGQALDTYKSKVQAYLTQYSNMDPAKYPNAEWYLQSTQSNLDFYVLHGDPNARLQLPAPAPAAPSP